MTNAWAKWAAKQPEYALKNCVRALGSPLGQFANSASDNLRLEAAREELKNRGKHARK